VVVGDGGAGSGPVGSSTPPTPGGLSSFGSDPALVAIGGGAGSGPSTPPEFINGGSGGGGASFFTTQAGGLGTPGQGEAGRRQACVV
jgi:hypothetical protein